jgi:hypothetical protein
LKSKNYAMVVIIALAFFAIPSISSYNQQVVAGIPKAFSLQTAQTLGVNVTVLGTIKASNVAPACSLSNPPCTIPETSVYYVVVNGRNYRLVFSNTTELPNVIGSHVIVTGLYVTPSAFQTAQWTPLLFFYGDIYVQKIVYFLRLPD